MVRASNVTPFKALHKRQQSGMFAQLWLIRKKYFSGASFNLDLPLVVRSVRTFSAARIHNVVFRAARSK